MRNCRRGIGLLIAVVLLVTLFPAFAAAEQAEQEPSGQTAGQTASPTDLIQPAGEVTIRAGAMEITVGTDAAKAAENPEHYALFAQDGSYAIELQEGSSLPCKITFISGEQEEERTFATGEESFNVFGHEFRVAVPQNQAPDEVIYNLEQQEVTVGRDATKAEATPWMYKLFDEDGNYTIELEDDAFFPYEVQFQYQGKTENRWFESPKDTVTLGGHTFRVHTKRTDAAKLEQAGVEIGGKYIQARPEEKRFRKTPGIATFSLLPIKSVNLTLNLNGYTAEELKNASFAQLIEQINAVANQGDQIQGTPLAVWVKRQYSADTEAKYTPISDPASAIVDLSPVEWYDQSYTIELIVGSVHQLDPNNTRYMLSVTVGLADIDDFEYELYIQGNDGTRTKVEVLRTTQVRYTRNDMWGIQLRVAPAFSNEVAYVGMKPKAVVENLFDDIKIYTGTYNTAGEVEQAVQAGQSEEITSGIWKQTMGHKDAGYKANYLSSSGQPRLTMVLKKAGKVIQVMPFTIGVEKGGNNVWLYGIYREENGTLTNVQAERSYNSSSDLWTIKLELDQRYPVDAAYYVGLDFSSYHSQGQDTDHVVKAVEGHFESLEACASLPDIKQKLLLNQSPFSPADCYGPKRFDGEGVKFTIFADDGDVLKVLVNIVGTTEIPGSGDTYFQARGADQVARLYALPSEHDAYYNNGFQTLFTLDDVDLTKVKLKYWTGDQVQIFAGSVKQDSGVSEQDFSSGPVQYSAAAQDGKNLKNYWVTLVKKHTGGPKLFVNGINGPGSQAGVKREVFFDSYAGQVHDIFIANVGDQAMNNVNVQLTGAEHVKLDTYWTVGGTGNNTLAAFTTTELPSNWKDPGQLPNVAKIRLLPDGEGLIKGKLTITGGTESVEMELTGTAGDPKILTTSIPEAVKYVPYSALIQTSNMYDWNRVTFTTTDRLPTGVTLLPNGEIYGVPAETGSFPITVRMENSYRSFPSQTASFTLVVKQNTDQNVDASTDTGYEIRQRVPSEISSIQDEIFWVEGEFGEFIDFWLDGRKLSENTDYTAQEGSTKITILSQTLRDAGPGQHTIAAEYRVDGDTSKELKRAAQNFRLKTGGSHGGNDTDHDDEDPNGGGKENEPRETWTPGQQASLAKEAATFASDPDSPFYRDVAFPLELGQQRLTSMRKGGAELQYGSDYVYGDGQIVVYKEYLSTLEAGRHTLRIQLDNGTTLSVYITVLETGVGKRYEILSAFPEFFGNGDVTARIDAAYEGFKGINFRGAGLSGSNYTSRSGSTIITLKEAFLRTLENGEHVFRVEFDDGYADLTLTVHTDKRTTDDRGVSAWDAGVPQTGDTGKTWLWGILLVASVFAAACAFTWRAWEKKRGRW